MKNQAARFVLLANFCLWSGGVVSAQPDSLFALPDSAKAFTLQHFHYLVLQNHPTAKQAGLLTEMARQEIRLARGNFDPKLEIAYQQKNYSDTEYYSLLKGELKFPSVFPVDPKIGFEQNRGDFVNPQDYISNEFDFQQFYSGISMPLGRGLLTDERRAALNQARLFANLTEAEQVKIINKLLLDGVKSYWKWYFSYYHYRIQERGVSIASEIFRRVKLNTMLGESSVLDTIQASITLQERQIQRQEAWLEFENAGIHLSTYLWDSASNPLALPRNWAPVRPRLDWSLTSADLLELKEQAQQYHPELLKVSVKLDQLEVERKLNREFVKPRLDVSYTWLNQPFDPSWNTSFRIGDDYKLGIDFSFPLLIRKERAKLEQTKVKLASTRLEQGLLRRQVNNQIDASYNALVNSGILIAQLDRMVDNYERILQAEFINLENGESDLFKINVQQEKLIQAQSKYLKMLSEYESNKAELYWAAGVERLGIEGKDPSLN